MESQLDIRSRTNVVLWLFSGCFLIFVMVVVGGVTRLTGSGLSITKWNVVTGTIPPVSEADWEKEFAHYRETPQFREINAHFDLSDFKQIYWWEYIHRLIGRVIGVVFVIPFTWFAITKQLTRPLVFKSLLLFFMGGLQGFLGWYMVKSGLVDIPSVSHYRLALHLTTAFATFGLTFWFAFELIHTVKIQPTGWVKNVNLLVRAAFVLTVFQIIFGAFVAGLKAGYVYNTWPLMGGGFLSESVYFSLEKYGWKALIDTIPGVQALHRYMAVVIAVYILSVGWYAVNKQRKETHKLSDSQMNAMVLVLAVLLLQFALGIFTLIYAVPVTLGVLHQAGAFFLFASLLYLMHRLTHQSVRDAKLK